MITTRGAGTTTRRGRFLAACAAAVALVLSTSCASIPSSGPVEQIGGVGSSEEKDQSIRVLARPPRPNASPIEIVEGFLAASASFENDHEVARQFLLPAAAEEWAPGAGVTVYDSDGETDVGQVGEGVNAVAFTAQRVLGRIGPRGDYTPGQDDRGLRELFVLQRDEDQQWRIENPPGGVLLSSGDVERAFRAVNVYFPDARGEVLVPDTIYVPALGRAVRTRLVDALLGGPTSWLAPAVGNAFPDGTRLEDEVGAPAESGTVHVPLSPEALTADPVARGTMLAQIAYTLQQLPGVTAVRVTAGGLPLVVPGSGEVTSRADWPELDPAAEPIDPYGYVVARGRLEVLGDPQRPVNGWLGGTSTLSAAAVSLDGSQQAGVVDEGGEDVLRAAGTASAAGFVVHRARDIDQLSWDRFNRLWFVEHGRSRDVVRLARAGAAEPREVEVEGLGDRRIRSLRVSRDGARVALVLVPERGSDRGELRVGRVRDGGDGPRVDGLRRVESAFDTVSDVAWSDDHVLAVVGALDGGAVQSYRVALAGASVVAVGSLPGMVSVAAAPSRARLAGTADGVVWADSGSGWRRYGEGGPPLYPG